MFNLVCVIFSLSACTHLEPVIYTRVTSVEICLGNCLVLLSDGRSGWISEKDAVVGTPVCRSVGENTPDAEIYFSACDPRALME